MTNTMTYKGHAARIEYHDEDGIFTGGIAVSAMVRAFMPTRWTGCAKPFTRLSKATLRSAPGSAANRTICQCASTPWSVRRSRPPARHRPVMDDRARRVLRALAMPDRSEPQWQLLISTLIAFQQTPIFPPPSTRELLQTSRISCHLSSTFPTYRFPSTGSVA